METNDVWTKYLNDRPGMQYSAVFGEPYPAPTFAVVARWTSGRQGGVLILSDCSVYLENEWGRTIDTICNR